MAHKSVGASNQFEEELTNTVYRIGHDVTTINSLKEASLRHLTLSKKTLDLAGTAGSETCERKRKLEHEAELRLEELAKKQAEKEQAEAEVNLHEELEEVVEEETKQRCQKSKDSGLSLYCYPKTMH